MAISSRVYNSPSLKESFFLHNGITSNFFNCSAKIFSVLVRFIALVKNGRYTSTLCLKIVAGIDPLPQRYPNADLKICQYLRPHVKIICGRFHLKAAFTF